MNSFRSRLMGGAETATSPLLAQKPGQTHAVDGLDQVVTRTETRSANHRDEDRHRLSDEEAVARWKDKDHVVHLINLSGGGAMIGADFVPRLWDRVDLTLGDCGTLECAVRWIKGDRLGLEFAHETQIDADPQVRAETLHAVIARSFPDFVHSHAAPDVPEVPVVVEDAGNDIRDQSDHAPREAARHPMIWNAEVHFNHDSNPVRLRNISARGALIEGSKAFPVGAEVLLDLGEAGTVFGTVHWSRGEQAGLRFQEEFDVTALSRSKPDIAPKRWNQPSYLREGSNDSSPWASGWNRLNLNDLQSHLEGFLKR